MDVHVTEKLEQEINDGVVFWCYEEKNNRIAAVMGIQQVEDVTLIRHAYVRSAHQHRGIGSLLLIHLRELANRPILIGTWADASWAIHFYEKHGFQMVSAEEKAELLKGYWTVPDRQIENSVVLVGDPARI